MKKNSSVSSSSKNRFVELQAPVQAGLAEIIDWKHPLLKKARTDNQAGALLAAWREDQAYRWFFDRPDIQKMFEAIPQNTMEAWQGTLDYFRKYAWKKNTKGADQNKWPPVPVDANGNLVWECFTAKNNEYICAVNRFNWLPALAAAAWKSGKQEDQDLVFKIVDDWFKSCPVVENVILEKEGVWKHWYRPWAPLNTALRTKHLAFALHILWDSPALTAERFGSYVRMTRQHLAFLGRVPPRVDTEAKGNHFLMESEGLLYASLLPWLKESKDARETAIHNFSRCVANQIFPDGVHIECSPSYHRGCMQWFSLPLLLCKLNNWKLDDTLAAKIPTMIDFGLHMINPDGYTTSFEDGSSHRDGYASEWLISKMCDRPIPVPATAPGGLVAFLRNIPKFSGQPAKPFALAVHFQNGGFAAARNSWNSDASALIMKLDGFGGGHSHADFLSFSFAWKGRTIIDERGTYSYNDDRKSVECKLAPAHTVLLLGDRDMFNPGDLKNYWDGKGRFPCVKVTGIHCTPHTNGAMGVGGRVMWDEKTWWSRHIDFDPETGLTITDQTGCKRNEPARIQFYVASTKIVQDSPTSVRTDDIGQPNIAITTKGNQTPKIKVAPTEIYHGFFNAIKASLVTIHLPPSREGWWETKITGV